MEGPYLTSLLFLHTLGMRHLTPMVLLRLLCAYGLALGVYGQTFNNETTGVLGAILSNLEHYWSYGRSPPVYPSRKL